MIDQISKSTPLTHFARHMTAEQKQAVHNKVIDNAIARQRRILERAREVR